MTWTEADAIYHLDVLSDGFLLAPIATKMLKLGVPPRMALSSAASTLEASAALWQAAGLQQVRTYAITVQRTFDNFEDYWRSGEPSNTLRPMFEAMDAEGRELLKANVRRRLQAEDGPLTVSARANAICGIKL